MIPNLDASQRNFICTCLYHLENLLRILLIYNQNSVKDFNFIYQAKKNLPSIYDEFLIIFQFSDKFNEEDRAGEVSVQIDLFTHPGTGEHKVTVKGKI